VIWNHVYVTKKKYRKTIKIMEKNEKKIAENGMNGKYISNVELLPVPVKRGKNIMLIIFICI